MVGNYNQFNNGNQVNGNQVNGNQVNSNDSYLEVERN